MYIFLTLLSLPFPFSGVLNRRMQHILFGVWLLSLTALGVRYFINIYILSLFIWGGWAERERERERERQRIPSRLYTVRVEPDMGLEPMNCEIMT